MINRCEEIERLVYGTITWHKNYEDIKDIMTIYGEDDVKDLINFINKFSEEEKPLIIRCYGSTCTGYKKSQLNSRMIVIKGSMIKHENYCSNIWCGTRWITLLEYLTKNNFIPPFFPLLNPYGSIGGIIASKMFLYLKGLVENYNLVSLSMLSLEDNRILRRSLFDYEKGLILNVYVKLSGMLHLKNYVFCSLNRVKRGRVLSIYKWLSRNGLHLCMYTILKENDNLDVFMVAYTSLEKLISCKEKLCEAIEKFRKDYDEMKIGFSSLDIYVKRVFSLYKEYLKCKRTKESRTEIRVHRWLSDSFIWNKASIYDDSKRNCIIDIPNKIALYYPVFQ